MTESDLDLLRRFVRDRAQDAFSELVQRHVDLVYCAAMRQVRSPQLAEEIAQSVFTDLAKSAARLKSDTILTAWLYEVTRRTAINVLRGEARRRLREQVAWEMNAMNASCNDWIQIEPILDEAMNELDQVDRTAILLRYFENKSLRDVGVALGTTDDTARKRVNRAVEQLRKFFTKRGITVGASALAAIISGNALSAAPHGLATAISTAATVAGNAVITTTALNAAQTITMTAFQKVFLAGLLIVFIGTAIYKAHEASALQKRSQAVEQSPLATADVSRSEGEELKIGLAANQPGPPREARSRETRPVALWNFDSSPLTNRFATVTAIVVTNPAPRAISDEQIRANIQTHVGDIYRRVDVDRDVRGLYASGLFSSIRVLEESNAFDVTLTYVVQERIAQRDPVPH